MRLKRLKAEQQIAAADNPPASYQKYLSKSVYLYKLDLAALFTLLDGNFTNDIGLFT